LEIGERYEGSRKTSTEGAAIESAELALLPDSYLKRAWKARRNTRYGQDPEKALAMLHTFWLLFAFFSRHDPVDTLARVRLQAKKNLQRWLILAFFVLR
jgi:hypothetical protein